jgi:hypothetical protein
VRTAEREHLFAAFGEPPPRSGMLVAPDGTRAGQVAGHELLELALPFAAVGARPGDRLELVLHLLEGDVPLGRLPRDGHLEVRVPDEQFDAENWML